MPTVAPSPALWLPTTKSRLGHCLTFGLSPSQTRRATHLLRLLALHWRDLTAGTDGYLTQPARRGLDRYKVVWGDMDSMGHVNNVRYNKWAEGARVEWARKLAGGPGEGEEGKAEKRWEEVCTNRGVGLILKTIRTEFKFPITYPDHITVVQKFRQPPSPSHQTFSLDVLILSERFQRPAARIEEDNLMYDYRLGKKTTLQPWMMGKMQETWELQEAWQEKWLKKRTEIDEEVTRLEKESWDREGAVEDLGSASGKR